MLYEEFTSLRNQLKNKELPEHLYKSELEKIEQAISTHALAGQWKGFCQYLTPEVFLALKWSTEVLQENEQAIDQNTWDDLANQLAELEVLLSSSELPDPVVELVNKHIRIIRKSLRNYGVKGIEGIEDAVYQMAGELIQKGDIIKEHQSSKEVAGFGKLLRKVSKIPGLIRNTDKTIESGNRLYELFKPYFDGL